MAQSVVIAAPQVEPVPVADALAALRYDDSSNAPILAAHLLDARERAEHELGRSLITQTRRLSLVGWPACADGVALDYLPVQEVVKVDYWDGSQWLTLAQDAYTLESISPLRHMLTPVAAWPGLGARNGVRVRIDFIAGFGDTGEAVPAAIKQWIVITAGHAMASDSVDMTEAPNDYINRRLDAWRTRI